MSADSNTNWVPGSGPLPEIAALEFTVSEALGHWYQKGVYNDFQIKEGDDPSEFFRLQQEHDRETCRKFSE